MRMGNGCSVVGQMQNPTYGFGEKKSGTSTASGDNDAASLKSDLSGETLKAEKEGGGRKGGSLMKRLLRRKGGEEKDKGKE